MYELASGWPLGAGDKVTIRFHLQSEMSWIKLKSTLIKPDLFNYLFVLVLKSPWRTGEVLFHNPGIFLKIYFVIPKMEDVTECFQTTAKKNIKETKKKRESTSCVSEAKNSQSEKGIKSKRPQKRRFCQSQN